MRIHSKEYDSSLLILPVPKNNLETSKKLWESRKKIRQKRQTTVRFDSHHVRLRTGEVQRKTGSYMYRWTDKLGKRNTIYAATLEDLREQEEQILVDQHDGIKAFLKDLPYLLVTMYAKQYGLATRTDDEILIGARIDAVIPELRLAFVFSQKGTDREAKVEEVLRFLCKAKRIQLFVIRQKDPIALATEIKQAFTKANLFINSDSQRDVAHLRKRYFAQKNNGN